MRTTKYLGSFCLILHLFDSQLESQCNRELDLINFLQPIKSLQNSFKICWHICRSLEFLSHWLSGMKVLIIAKGSWSQYNVEIQYPLYKTKQNIYLRAWRRPRGTESWESGKWILVSRHDSLYPTFSFFHSQLH